MAQQERPATMLGAEFSALEKVPPEARVFGFWDQAALWFGAASLPAAWYYGALMAGWKGLPGPVSLRLLLGLSALGIIPLALLPLLAPQFVGFYIFWLDFLGAIVIPLWTITLVDYFLVKREQYTDDLFRERGGLYWYRNGWNWPAVASLLLGTAVYWVVAFGFPRVREGITATLPTVVIAALVYLFWQASQGQRARSRSKG